MKNMKILIIKLGLSETLDPEIGKVVSLGDVLRCTCILTALREKYENAHISWLVAKEALALVNHNSLIDRILVWDEFMGFSLMREHYDIVINLEKLQGICALADMIQAWEKMGFRFNSQSGEYDAHINSFGALSYIKNKAIGANEHRIWQQTIVEMLGCEWKGQDYCLGYKPNPKEKFKVGLNYLVGQKWPTKAMSKQKWDELAKKLESSGISYSYQQGKSDLYEYMDWISGCEVLVTNDSLGVHIALALHKKVITLFGPTSGDEIYFYGRGEAIYPSVESSEYKCIPCYLPQCEKSKHCMDFIDLDKIVELVKKYIS